MKPTASLVFALAALAGGCAPSAPAAESAAALTVGIRLDAVRDAQIVGASADRRRIAYAWPCNAATDEPPSLALFDAGTGAVTQLGPIARCGPSLVSFSGDGSLAAWPRADGVAVVWSARTGAVVQVSRPELRALAVAFSPDSRWLVVASTGEPPASVLDAWDANLSHHVEVGGGIFVNPFGGPDAAVRFSPDGRRIVFLGDAQAPFPVGTLTEWTRTSPTAGRARVVARGVAAWIADAALAHVAVVDGVTVGSGPPSDWLHGRVAVVRLADGHTDVVEADAPATPQLFAPDGSLVYFVGPVGGVATGRALKLAAPGAAPHTVDDDVFMGYAPNVSVALSGDGGELAYTTAFDPMRFSGELHVAKLRGGAPVVVAKDAVPMAFGFVDDTLGFLHASTSSFPGVALGALALWDPSGAARDVAGGVTQVGLRFDADAGRIVYFDHWDGARAAGDLRRFASATGRTRLVAHDAFAMATQFSPDGATAGIVAVGPTPPEPGTPPRTTLALAAVDGGGPRLVQRDTTSFVVADGGRVFYTTDDGLWAAVVF